MSKLSIQDTLVGFLAVAVVGSLLILYMIYFSNTYNISFNSQTMATLNQSVINYNQQSNQTLTQATLLLQTSNQTGSFDNPFISLSSNVFNIITVTISMISYVPVFLISLFSLLPFSIPAIVINFILFVFAASIVFLFINWLRGGQIKL